LPAFIDKNLTYTLAYPHRLFINIYEEIPIEEISQGDVFKRKQMASIHGVYSSYTDAEKALKETSTGITAHKGWRLGGKAQIIQKGAAYIFILPFFEISFLRGGSW